MTLLSLDQSSKVTGYAVFEDEDLVDCGNFCFTDSFVEDRLVKIRQKVLDLIDEYSVDKVVFEDIQLQGNVGNNIQTFKVLAEVYGVVLETLREKDISYESILAVSWKSTLGIRGRTRTEQKRNTQQFVSDTYGIDVNQDTADAIGIGVAFLRRN